MIEEMEVPEVELGDQGGRETVVEEELVASELVVVAAAAAWACDSAFWASFSSFSGRKYSRKMGFGWRLGFKEWPSLSLSLSQQHTRLASEKMPEDSTQNPLPTIHKKEKRCFLVKKWKQDVFFLLKEIFIIENKNLHLWIKLSNLKCIHCLDK